MKALILAAGYATRLFPLTIEYPKPLLKVGRRAIIDYIIDKLEEIQEVDEIIVVTNSKFIARFRSWKEKLQTQKEVDLVDDLTHEFDDRRGAIGDMDFAIGKKRIADDLLVIGGDNIFDGNLEEFIAFAKNNAPHPVIGVYNIRNRLRARRYGVIKLDGKNKVVDFQEKPQNPKSTLVAMCLYYFPKAKLKLVRKYLAGENKNDATGFYIDWLRRHESVFGFIFDGSWYDIGHPKIYKEAKEVYVNA